MRIKLCRVGLISLFAWNAVFGAFGGLVLCIHENFDVHVDEDAAAGVPCSDSHEEADQAISCVDEDESCVDIELIAELLPATRLDLAASFVFPQAVDIVLIDHFKLVEPSIVIVSKMAASRAPPHVCWLTDFYLKTAVLQV